MQNMIQAEDISSISEDELNNLYNELKVTDDSAINNEENDIIWVDNSHLTVNNFSQNLLKSEKANKKEAPNDVIAIYESPVPAQLETYINQRDEYMNIVESTTTTEDLSYSAVEKSDSWDAAEKGPFFYAVISVTVFEYFNFLTYDLHIT
uniref:Uncharacterized protein n=1 Tax=Acrobeloides nanus TaxID=290746 RepID=A0A914E9Z0_9BILA